MLRVHHVNPADAVAAAYVRIHRERMADIPIHNEALSVESVDFRKWQGHWLGVVVTPWCMSLLLVPGSTEQWETPGDNQRRFVKLPVGELAFLGSDEPELGEFQSCALFSPMGQFADQPQAVSAARAALAACLQEPARQAPATGSNDAATRPSGLSRRRLLGLRSH